MYADEPQIVPVKVVVDYTFCWAHWPWQKYAQKVVKEASAEFEQYFNIKFEIQEFAQVEVKPVPVPPKTPRIHAELAFIVRQVVPPENGFVIWFSSRYYGAADLCRGSAVFPTGQHCMVTDGMETEAHTVGPRALSRVLIHELLHLFGIPHSEDENSIMAPRITSGAKIDKLTISKLKVRF